MIPAVIDSPELHSLSDLGVRAPIVLTQQRPLSRRVPFSIPRSRDPTRHYQVISAFRLHYGDGEGGGAGYVNTLTGKGVSSSVEFKTKQDGRGLLTTWNTVGVHGTRRYTTRRQAIRVRFTNYFVRSDARPGRHALRFQLEAFDGFPVSRVVVFPHRSGVRSTTVPPYTLRLSLSTVRESSRRTTVKLDIINFGPRPARQVELVVLSGSCARARPSASRRLPTIGGRRVRTTTFTFRRTKPNACAAQIAVTSSAGSASATLRFPHTGSTPSSGAGGEAWVVWPVAGAAAGLVLLAWRRRRVARAGN
jgi:hypothetical protein